MQFRVGGYTHPNGEVQLMLYEVIPIKGPRHERAFSYHKMHIRIDLQLTPDEDTAARDPNPITERINRQLLFHTKISNLVAVYENDYQSCGFLHDDGSQSQHYINNSHPNNVSGVHTVDARWPRGDGDEYSTVRTASVVLGAVFDTSVSGIYAYRERVRFIGTGGPDWVWVRNVNGVPTQQPLSLYTPQLIIQSGTIVGMPAWALGNVPPPLFPAWEKGIRRVSDFDYPEWQGNQYRLYGFDWTYVMEAPAGQVGFPSLY
jgi:hypothetical protein